MNGSKGRLGKITSGHAFFRLWVFFMLKITTTDKLLMLSISKSQQCIIEFWVFIFIFGCSESSHHPYWVYGLASLFLICIRATLFYVRNKTTSGGVVSISFACRIGKTCLILRQ